MRNKNRAASSAANHVTARSATNRADTASVTANRTATTGSTNHDASSSTATHGSATTKQFSWKQDTWVKPYLKHYKKALFLALFLGVLTIGFASALMFTAGWLIGGSAEMPYSILLLGTPLLCVRIFGVGKPILQYAERLTSHDWVLHMTSSLRVKLYRAFDSQGIFFHSLYRLGDALGLLAEDIGHIQNLYLRTIFPTVIAWILGIALVIGFGLYTWWMGVLVCLLLVIELLVVPLVSVSVNGARQAKHKALKATFYTEMTDNVLGITDWILSGRHKDYLEHHKTTQTALRELESAGHSFNKKRDLVLQVFFALGACVVFIWAALQFSGQTGGNANWILAFVLGYFPLIDAFAPLSAAATEARAHQDSVERLNKLPIVEDSKNEVIHETIQESEEKAENSQPAKQPPEIVLENVSFSYPGSNRLLLDNLSLRIPAKQKIAVLGKSGTGKSTLASLIRGDLTPTAGTVELRINTSPDQRTTTKEAASPTQQQAIQTCTLGDLAPQYFGVIQQRTYVFNATLRDNLLIGNPNASDDELIQTLHRVGLDTLLNRLPKGLDTIIDEAGLRFSGGERHRVALARVLLQDAPIIILDEPMVGLDPVTENQVLNSIFSVLENKTIIMVTHHLQGVSKMDRVLFIENGHLKLDGHPKQLAETSEYFQNLLALEQTNLLPLLPQEDQCAQ